MTAQPPLWFGVGLYLACLPFLPPQPAALALLGLAAWFAATGLRHHAPSLSELWPLLPFLAVCGLAAARAEDPVLAAGIVSFQLPGIVLFVLLVADRSIGMTAWLRLFTLFSLVIAASVLFGSLRLTLGAEQLFAEDVPQAVLRLSGNSLLSVPNDVCACAILSAFPLGLLAAGARGADRGVAVLSLGLSLLVTILVRSRTGLLILGVETGFAAFARPRALAPVLALVPLAAFADWWFALGGLHKLAFTDAHDLHGVAGRAGLWVAAWRMFLSAPLLGHGAQSFGPSHFAYLPSWAPLYPEGRAPWAHNLFLDILAEQGLLGAAAFLCLVVPPLIGVLRARCRLEARVAVWALAGFAIAACLELSFIRRIVPLLLFCLLGFAAKASRPHEEPAAGR